MWFFGRKTREQFEEKQREVDFLRELTKKQEERLREVEGKVKVMVDALSDAQTKTESLVEEAKKKAEDLLAEAQAKAETMLAEAKEKADAAVREAGEKAEEIRLNARVDAENTERESREKSEKLVRSARLEAARYEETVEAYNRLVEESVAQAIRSSERYAELIRAHKLNSERVELQAGAPDEAQPLPDADGDPAQLMRNIYRLQNRDIPETVRREEPEIPGLFGNSAADDPEDTGAVPTVSSVLQGNEPAEKDDGAGEDPAEKTGE